MSTRGRSIAVVLGASALVTAVAAAPAHAGDTTATFTLTAGSLSISQPTDADLGSDSVSAGTVAGNLGQVTVTDDRGAIAAAWTVTVESTAFTATVGGDTATIPATNVTYTPGSSTGSATAVATPGLLGGALPLPVMTGAAVGTNTESWDPTISIAIPQAVAGTYTGTITHSVS